MRITLLSAEKRYLSGLGNLPPLLNPFTFARRPEELSPSALPDSAFATPGRYVAELAGRLQPSATPVIVNPLLDPTGEVVQILFQRLTGGTSSPLVIADRNGFPVAYRIPPGTSYLIRRHITLLSCVDPILDRELLSRLLGTPCALESIPRDVTPFRGNGFSSNPDLATVWRSVASGALDLLDRHRLTVSGDPLPGHALPPGVLEAIGYSAYIPYHAGDLLFFAIALRESGILIRSVATSERFAPILRMISPSTETETFPDPPPRHRPGDPSDEEYFLTVRDRLSPFRFTLYLRPSRDYAATTFHLIDHFAFALGFSPSREEELISRRLSPPPLHTPTDAPPPVRVLLHFDAGWPLKIYPPRFRENLIDDLLMRGYEVTVLGNEERDHGRYRTVPFTTLEALKELILSHHLLVGSDSFPSHFAAHLLGVPTICLFGPTRPENSDAPPSGYYRALSAGLHCSPCGNLDHCPRHNRDFCGNFTLPAEVVETIGKMVAATLRTDTHGSHTP